MVNGLNSHRDMKDTPMAANSHPKVLLLIPHLGDGGAERVTTLLARGLSAEKYELHLGLITQSQTSEELTSRVHLHALGARRVRSGALKLLVLVHQLKPDLILSGMFHLNFLVLLLRPFFPPNTRVLIRQNGTVSAALAFGGLPGYTRLLYRVFYRRADRVICQSHSMAEDLACELGLEQNRIAVLPNPVDVDVIRGSSGQNPASQTVVSLGCGPHLLAMGRLSAEKGFDLLLRAFASVRREFPEASLLIAGAGPEKVKLRALCSALGLDCVVRFAGAIDCPWPLFAEATLFVLPSRHEGLPNALLEAAAGGLPIVALPASGGIVDLLRTHPGVWLAPEVSAEALAASLLTALRALKPGQRFAHPFVDEFRIDRAVSAYEELIDRTLIESRNA
jgi:glycosyltransferase involved in cell wall biosynthesis